MVGTVRRVSLAVVVLVDDAVAALRRAFGTDEHLVLPVDVRVEFMS